MGKASLLVSLAKPPNKAMMGFDTKVSPNRLASRISVSGLGAPFWKDVVVGLKKDSHASLGAVGDVVGRPSFDRDFATVPWMLDLEGFSVVGDRGELGLSILDDVFFLEAFDSILEGGPTLVVRGRDAFLFPEIGCPSGVVEDIEDFDASSPVISPSKAICELVVDSLQVVSVFSSSINQLGIRGIIFNDNSVGAVLVTFMRSLFFREGKVVMALPFDIRVPMSFLRSSPDVFLMDS